MLDFALLVDGSDAHGAKIRGPTPKPTTKRVMERKIASFDTPRPSAVPGKSPVGIAEPNATERHSMETDKVTALLVSAWT
jgi:hypothetical protein